MGAGVPSQEKGVAMRIRLLTVGVLCCAAVPIVLGFVLAFVFESFIAGAMLAHDYIHTKKEP